jgi:hypothetical protein
MERLSIVIPALPAMLLAPTLCIADEDAEGC